MTAPTNVLLPSTPGRFDFEATLAHRGVDLSPRSIETLQINITKLCNQACVHCHVDASPRRRESMSDEVIDQVLSVVRRHASIKVVDITGGAPELHPRFQDLVRAVRGMGRRVIVRHNLTVTIEPHPLTKASMAGLPEFFRSERVEIISSLPYYQEFFTDKQRGSGVFKNSIESLKRLNAKGFGVDGSGLTLDLVYNPVGAFLPAAQAALEADYKRELKEKFGVTFNRLFAITNMPIHRFKAQLIKAKGYAAYMEKLLAAFNPTAAQGVMCRSMVSVAYDGTLYDCDFNQMLMMPLERSGQRSTIAAFDETAILARTVRFGDHCFGCTAGAGSSCGGTTT